MKAAELPAWRALRHRSPPGTWAMRAKRGLQSNQQVPGRLPRAALLFITER